MRKERGRKATVQGFLTALLVASGMVAVAAVTVVLSNSQQFPTRQAEVAGNATSSSVAPLNQSTTEQQGAAPSPETSYVKILLGSADSVSYSFSPVEVTVVIGVNNTVTWVNNDNAAHTVTASDGSFSSGNIGSGGVYTYTFTTPGAYRYYCAYHEWMVGTVVVEA
jgi:plastocyanin